MFRTIAIDHAIIAEPILGKVVLVTEIKIGKQIVELHLPFLLITELILTEPDFKALGACQITQDSLTIVKLRVHLRHVVHKGGHPCQCCIEVISVLSCHGSVRVVQINYQGELFRDFQRRQPVDKVIDGENIGGEHRAAGVRSRQRLHQHTAGTTVGKHHNASFQRQLQGDEPRGKLGKECGFHSGLRVCGQGFKNRMQDCRDWSPSNIPLPLCHSRF